MKRSNLFIIMLTLLFPLAGIGQNQATIVDDVYFNPASTKNTTSGNQTVSTKQKPNYKNGAKEIVFTERQASKPTAIHDTVYVVGQAGDKIANTRKQTSNIKTDPSIIHDTIYVTENAMGEAIDSLKGNQEQGHYLNGFNGTESDLEYAERIRRFHNPKYTIFIGSPAYNDIYFLNNNDWNVYVDDSYAYVTPTWTNPYWWDYNYSPYSYSGFGWGFGFGWNNYPWSFYGGFSNYYGYGGLYGSGYGYPYCGFGDYYGYNGYYGYGGGYGNWYGNSRNRNDEGARREISNYSGRPRLGERQGSSASTMIGSSSTVSRGAYTAGTTRNSVTNNGTTRSYVSSRTVANPASGIGLVRSGGTRSSVISNGISNSRSNNFNINTRPRTYSTTVTATPNGNYSSRQSSVGYSNRTSYTSNSGSRTVISNSSSTPSRSSYSSENYSNTSRSSSPSYSSGSSRGSYSSGSSSVSSGGSTRGSSASSGGRR